MSGEADRVHGTAVALGNRAVLLRGPSGSGKSDLAFRCLGLAASLLVPEPVKLVADDQVILNDEGSTLIARAPPTLFGKIEIRGVGILEVDAVPAAELVLVADLVNDGPIDRYPDPWPVARIKDFDLPLLRLRPFESSSALKLVTAIRMAPWPRAPSKA